MSSDKRPAKVRVFSSSSGAEVPSRRSGDVGAPVLESAAPPAEVVGAESADASGFLLLAGLFVAGCAIGGIILALFGLIPGSTS